MMNHNHSRYQVRLDFIHRLLSEHFGLPDTEVTPIAYDPECPFKYNNFVYRISLSAPLNKQIETCQVQPGCVPIPRGSSKLILRLTNPDAQGMGSANRVENEVAIITLAAAALGSIFKPHIVPHLYGWSGSRSAQGDHQQGWILQELISGSPLDECLDSMDLEDKKRVFAQIAKVLKCLQEFPLPSSITHFGGLTFDANGEIISAPMTSTGIGPWSSYEASFKARLEQALREADENQYIQGWHANGVRARLETFVEHGLPSGFEPLDSREQRAIIHADFSEYLSLNILFVTGPHTYPLTAPSNILFDASSGHITGIIDYDFSCTLHPSYEFLRSFSGLGGQFRGWSGVEGHEQKALKDAKLNCFPDTFPDEKDKESLVQWKVAKVWEDKLERAGCKRPSTMPGIDRVADVDALLSSILPWRVTNSDILRRQSDEVIRKCRDDNEGVLIKILEHNGF
ncbi:hypothetical protein N7466_010552 [Penicillium verhagenii]|uniref:uncharacterized protein n=1 Tax=Penicillium verhagenii TaxID=1562060 RepID=UPI002545252F|nr:uncharacterized protein N7466_010552 [Penicillium verhagenii]KAJ5918560.1 hypothetical protein N7466_010552 [Penicillium verhagenii]